MTDTYGMVFISLFSFLILASCLAIYRYFFPKKKINLFFLLIILSLLPLISIFRPGTYESGDLSLNVYKAMSFYDSLHEGNILPHWAGSLNAHYGYPLFLFVYPLPFYVISFFHFFGFSFLMSVKLLLASMFILSAIGMYFWIKEEFGKVSGFVAALFYVFAPYHLVDTHFRISIGEILSFALLPFVLFFVTSLLNKRSSVWFVSSILGLAFLLLCNPAISLVAFCFLALYMIFCLRIKKIRLLPAIFSFFVVYFWGLSLSCFYWLPVIFESSFTHASLYVRDIGYVHFQELLYSPWRLGFLFQGPHGELSFLLGYAQLLVIVFSLFLLFKRKLSFKEKRYIIFFVVGLFLVCFLMLSFSKPVWDTFPVLRNFQFTYRLLLFAALFTAVLAGIIVSKIPKKIVFLLCLFVILQTILNWGNRKNLPEITDTYFRHTLPLSTASGEGFQPAVPKWVNPDSPWEKNIPNSPIMLLSGDAEIKTVSISSTSHEYIVFGRTSLLIKENTLYFPGWKVFINTKEVPIKYTNKKYPGVITFQAPRGLSKMVVKFVDTPIRSIGKWVSGMSFLGLVIFCFFRLKRLLS